MLRLPSTFVVSRGFTRDDGLSYNVSGEGLSQLMAQDDKDDVTTLDHSGVDGLAWARPKILCTCRRTNKNITSEGVLILI